MWDFRAIWKKKIKLNSIVNQCLLDYQSAHKILSFYVEFCFFNQCHVSKKDGFLSPKLEVCMRMNRQIRIFMSTHVICRVNMVIRRKFIFYIKTRNGNSVRRTLAISLLCILAHALYCRKPRSVFLSQHGTEGEEGRCVNLIF